MPAVPFEAAAISAHPTRADWDAAAVEVLGAVLERWSLTVDGRFDGGFAATVLEVHGADGIPTVLKLGFPHVEAIAEAIALEAWPPGCGPRVLAQDAWRWALLLDRVEPGDPLSRVGQVDRDLAPTCALLASLWAPGAVGGVPPLAAIVGTFLDDARRRLPKQEPALRSLDILELVVSSLDDAVRLIHDPDVRRGVDRLLHGDFNPGNILRSGPVDDGRWVAIDPKPMIGEGAFDLAPLVAQLGSPFARRHPAAVLALRLGEAAELTGCDAGRAARWAVVRAALSVTWYLADDERRLAEIAAVELRAWADVPGRMRG